MAVGRALRQMIASELDAGDDLASPQEFWRGPLRDLLLLDAEAIYYDPDCGDDFAELYDQLAARARAEGCWERTAIVELMASWLRGPLIDAHGGEG